MPPEGATGDFDVGSKASRFSLRRLPGLVVLKWKDKRVLDRKNRSHGGGHSVAGSKHFREGKGNSIPAPWSKISPGGQGAPATGEKFRICLFFRSRSRLGA